MPKSMMCATVLLTLLAASKAFAEPCGLDKSSTLEKAKAKEAAYIVCSDLRAQGVAVSQRVDGDFAGAGYLVRVAKLDRVVVVALSRQDGEGRVLAHAQTSLSSLDELIDISPRLARSVVTGSPFSRTARKSTLTDAETRRQKTKHGIFLIGLGLSGSAVPGSPGVAPGLQLHLQYDLDRFALQSVIYGNGDSEINQAGASLGGKVFLSDGNLAPYLGGGLAWSHVVFQFDGIPYEGDGLELYLEGGAELSRFSRVRMGGFIRVGAPLYRARNVSDNDWMGDAKDQPGHAYGVPITSGLNLLF